MRRRAPSHSLALALALGAPGLACGSSETSSPATNPTPAPPSTTCAEGDVLVDGACQPLLPSAACQPGTRAALGGAACTPVGVATCAPGFTRHASGWGCVPIVPPTACAGATRDALGSTSCVPVGDCAGAFPPPSATIFVDASLPDAQVDATHTKTLNAAIAAAPAKATIAVSAGTYAEALLVQKAVTLVGRCAEKVILDAPLGAAAVAANADLVASGLTIRGGTVGVDVAPSTHVSLTDVVLEQNARAGISATDAAVVDVARSVIRGTRTVTSTDTTNGVFVDVDAKVTLDESAVVGAADAGLGATGGATITVHRSVVRDTVKRGDGVGGAGVRVFEGALVSLEESAVMGSVGTGVLAGKTKGALKLLRTTVLGTKPDLRFPQGFANGANITMTGTLDATDSTFADNAVGGVSAANVGSRATLDGCGVVGTVPGGEFGLATAGSATAGAALQARSSAFVGGAGIAMSSQQAGSTLDLDACLVSDVVATIGGSSLSAGHGGTAVSVVGGGKASVRSSTIQHCHELAVGVLDAGTTFLLERSLITDTKPNAGDLFGHGILARKGAELTVVRSVIEKSSAIGVAVSGATISLQGSFIRDNAVGIHVQDGSSLATGAEVPAPLDPLTAFVTDDTQFVGNATRVGSGEIPLPDVLAPRP